MLFFGKAECAVCGEKYRAGDMIKLRDGSLCPVCASKLSSLFPARASTSAENVRAYLEDQSRNRQLLSRFSPEEEVGQERKLFVDRHSGLFAFGTDAELQAGRLDVFLLSDLHSVELTVTETPLKPIVPKEESFAYDFDLILLQEHPILPRVRARINPIPVETRKHKIVKSYIHQIYLGEKEWKGGVAATLFGGDRRAAEDYLMYYTVGQQMVDALKKGR